GGGMQAAARSGLGVERHRALIKARAGSELSEPARWSSAAPSCQRGREKLLLLRRPFGATMRRIALTNAFCDLPTFFDTQVLAIERQWALPTNSTTLFVPLERISSVIASNRAALLSRIVERGRSSPVTRRLPPNSLAG